MKIRVNKRKWYFALFCLFCAAAVLVCAFFFLRVKGTLLSVQTHTRWRGSSDMRFAQIACFLPEDSPKAEGEIEQFRIALDTALTDSSLKAPEGASLYQDAYSAVGKVSISADRGSATAAAIGVGGNFFLFHPLQLRSGSYISGQDLMDDRVVLDEVLAWQLFGGYDVAGLPVTINGAPFYVAGVIRREDDFASSKAYTAGAGLFMSYSAFQRLTERGITCYEIVMPDPISGFAKGKTGELFSIGSGELIENSRRYGLQNLFSVIRGFGTRSMRSNGVIYPYWENAVRLTEDYLALLLVLMILFGICPAAGIIVLFIRLAVRVKRKISHNVPAALNSARERRREKNYAKAGK